MNYYLLSVSFLILSFCLSKQSYSNELSYEVHLASLYSIGEITSITCTSRGKDGHEHQLAHKSIYPNDNIVDWSIKAGEYDEHTVQTCTLRDQQENGHSRITAFRGAWKLDEIIWKFYTFYDFIFQPKDGKHIYYWYANTDGVHLYNSKIGQYELVVPKFNFKKPVAEIFISNSFDDKSDIALICKPDEGTNDGMLVNERALHHRNIVSWPIKKNYFSGNAYTCYAAWKNKTTGLTDTFSFTAFDDSWKLNQIVKEPYTLFDFIFNPFSRESTFLWSLNGNFKSLYNFKAKGYQVVDGL